MDGLATGVITVFAALSVAQGLFFIAIATAMKRRSKNERDHAVARFGLAKGCLSLVQAALLAWLLLEEPSDGWAIPVAFIVFVGGSWALSQLARRTPTDEAQVPDSDLEPPPIR